MSAVNYSLKNGINRTSNPAIGGVFAYGSYTSAGVFTLFDRYQYEDGTAFVTEPFDATKPLVWKGSNQYPHIGFENLSPNLAITPQPFPSFGIYLHPFVDAGARKDVGIRVIVPFSGNIALSSIIQRADLECGDDVGYRIVRNGVAIQSRQFISPSSTTTTINTPVTSFLAGDIIDFIVDAGSQNNYYCDDVALEINLSYQYSKIPTPVITTNPINCSTTSITGITAYVSEGTQVGIYDGTSLLYSSSVILNETLYNGSFSLNGVDLTNSLGKNLSLILEKSGDISSDALLFIVEDGGCVSTEPLSPIVTEADFCNKECDNQRIMTGTATKNGDIVVFKSPYTYGDPIVAAAVSDGINWTAKSSKFKQGEKYIAFLLNYDELLVLVENEVSITNISCEANCNLVSKFKGFSSGVANGVLRVFNSPLVNNSQPVVNGIIVNGIFDLKTELLFTNVDYILIATKIN